MSLVAAIRLAQQQHDAQTDKAGEPFIGHPLRVMAKVALLTNDEDMLAAAVLHDVLEDTPTTLADLDAAGISARAAVLVAELTHSPSDLYFEYIRRIRYAGSKAIALKLADIEDNMDPRRSWLPPKMLQRYQRARGILLGEIE